MNRIPSPRGVLLLFPKGSLVAIISLGGSAALIAVSGVLSARLLGPSGKGVLALALVWVGLAATVVDLGVSQAVTYYGSKEKDQRAAIWGQGTVTALLQTLVATPIVVLASELFIDSPASQLAVEVCLVSLPFSLILGNELNLLRGCGRYGAYSAIRFGQSAAWAAVVIVFFLADKPTTAGLILGFVATTIGATVWASIVLLEEVGPPSFSLHGASRYLRYGSLVWLAGMSFQVNARLDQVFLGGSVSAAELGEYAVAVSLASVLAVISTGIAVVTLPAVATASPRQAIALGRRNLVLALSSTTAIALILAAEAPRIVRLLLGPSFLPAVPLLRILLLGQIALGGNQILHEIYRGQGRLKRPAFIEGAGAIVTAVLLFIAVPRWGSEGAAWVSVAVYWPILIALLAASGPSGMLPGRKAESLRADDHIAYPDPTS